MTNEKTSPLEAFRRLTDNMKWLRKNVKELETYYQCVKLRFELDLELIETALKDAERLKECIDERGNLINECIETITEKKLKALEIIKEKKVDVAILLFYTNCGLPIFPLEEYNYYEEHHGGAKPLTQEEYDLLKEVLL